MSKQLLALLTGAAVLAFLAAGCGGSGNGSGINESPAKPTKAEYIKEATVLCGEHSKQIAGALTAYSKKHPLKTTTSDVQTVKVIDAVVLPGFRSEVEDLQGLPVPSGDEAQIEAMLAKFEAGLAEGEKAPMDLFSSATGEFSKGMRLAEAYGVKGCGTLIF